MVRTRFAPSPTGYLHIGGARTSSARPNPRCRRSSTPCAGSGSTGMRVRFFKCSASEGTRKSPRSSSRRAKRIAAGRARRIWTRCAIASARAVRFRNPDEGDVVFHDLVKGAITVANAELDDLVLLRADGVPTYNFGVVVDDLDMSITHVIRGDDHVNNTPRQVNIFQALGAPLPKFAHVPMILGADGERLSKRHGAVSVMQYSEDGYLPEALVNYLVRLGWSHGDEEMFTVEQFLQWFDLAHISHSAAEFNPEKLRWVNHQYLRQRPDADLASLVAPRIERAGGKLAGGPELPRVVALLKERSETLVALAAEAMMFYAEPGAARDTVTAEVRPALVEVAAAFSALADWRAEAIMGAIQGVIDKYKLKLPKLAMPLRMIVFGRSQTPNLGPVLALAGKKRVLERLQEHLAA